MFLIMQQNEQLSMQSEQLSMQSEQLSVQSEQLSVQSEQLTLQAQKITHSLKRESAMSMEKFVIEGGYQLSGEFNPSGRCRGDWLC
jgi:hypothetical protein